LKAVHPAVLVTVGHLLVDDAAPRRHPLDVSGSEGALVPQAVGVVDRPRQHVGDRLDPAVRVPGEAGQIVLRTLVAEVVEEQKRVVLPGVTETERTLESNAGSFKCRLRLDESFDGSNRHRALHG
jgi:hypothetical protein